MKNVLYLLLAVCCTACQTTKIKNKEYKVSSATVELGSIGTASSLSKFDNDFATRSFPQLHQSIRLDVQIVPFNKKINKIYFDKLKQNQIQGTVQYVDSLAQKPKFATFTFIDYAGITNEVNADYNKGIFNYIKDRGDASIVTGIAIVVTNEVILKLQQADAYYLVNDQTSKYTVALYKDGKKFDLINLQQGTVLAYTLGEFCWSVNDRHHWYVGDIVSKNKSCKGNTHKRIQKREETNLFKL